MLEQGPDFWRWFDKIQFSYIPLCSPNTCKDVFNPNVTTLQSNCADGLHFSAFIIIVVHVVILQYIILLLNTMSCRRQESLRMMLGSSKCMSFIPF